MGVVVVMSTPVSLSHTAQAVMVAATMGNPNMINDPVYRQCISAAIRAATDQLVVHEKAPLLMRGPDLERLAQRQHTRAQMLALASELEKTA